MIEIVNNKDNIIDSELTNKNGRINVIAINENNEVVLIKNHNTYYFLSEYIEEELNQALTKCLDEIKYHIDCNYEPVLLQKEYILDYPLIGDKTLNYTYYYIVNIGSFKIDDSNNTNKFSINLIPLKSLANVLEDNMFDNPRNRAITENMLNIVKILFK